MGKLSEYEKILGSDYRVNSPYTAYVQKHKLVDSFGQLNQLIEDIERETKIYTGVDSLPGIDRARISANEMYGE